jgi:pyruvate/oxaloacetate carboxyltransferase
VLRETRDYIRGLYGRPPSPVNRELSKLVLGGEEPLSRRPADMLESMMPRVVKELPKECVGKEEDYLSYALFPEATLKLLKGSKEAVPPPKSISVRVGDSMFDVEFSKR